MLQRNPSFISKGEELHLPSAQFTTSHPANRAAFICYYLKHRFVPIFFSSKVSTVLIQNHEIKNGGRFCGIAAKSVHHLHFLRFLREDMGRVSKRYVCEREKKLLKSTFYRIYIEISHLRHNVIKKASK